MIRTVLVCAAVPVLAVAFSLPAGLANAFESAAPSADAVDLSAYYGFGPLELFKLDSRSANMLSGDFNHDGLTDLMLVDNGHSRLDLLQQRSERAAKKLNPLQKPDVNAVVSDWRFEHRKIPVDKHISSLVSGDFNADGRTDVAYFGVPDRLVIRYQPESGDWTESESFRLSDVQPAQWSVASGDLNHDGLDDIAVIGRYETYILHQGKGGTMNPPKSLMSTSDKMGLLQVADVDGDGRNDLCYIADDDPERCLCARLQTSDGQLGPELRFEMTRPRSMSLHDVDGEPGQEIITIDGRTSRLNLSKIEPPAAADNEPASRLIQYGFGRSGSGRNRDLALGDIDGDGLTDVVVTDSEAARMIVFHQRPDLGLDLGTSYPGLVKSEHVRVADLDGDGEAEVIVLSPEEKMIGLSRYSGNRLTFPQALPVKDEPVVMELINLDSAGGPEIVYVSRTGKGRSSDYTLRALTLEESGIWKPFLFGDADSVAIQLDGTPDKMKWIDANRDFRPDLIIFLSAGRGSQLFTMDSDGKFNPQVPKGGFQLSKNVSSGSIFTGDREEPVVLAASDNFARNLRLSADGEWEVIDQYNATESSARIDGVVSLELDGSEANGEEVVLIDTGVRKLRILRREGELFAPWREVDIGTFPYLAAHVADLNGDKRPDLLLFGKEKLAVLYTGQSDPTLKELASFETKLEKTFMTDAVAGDLNADGQTDVAVVDTRSHLVELLAFSKKSGLQHAFFFKVFEEKAFSASQEGTYEPRESAIVDVTGDGLADLILLVHDRVLVYPQDGGSSAPEEFGSQALQSAKDAAQ